MAIERTLGFSSAAFRKNPLWDDCAELPRQRDHFFARGPSRRCVLHPERHGEADDGRYASQKSGNRRPAAG